MTAANCMYFMDNQIKKFNETENSKISVFKVYNSVFIILSYKA